MKLKEMLTSFFLISTVCGCSTPDGSFSHSSDVFIPSDEISQEDSSSTNVEYVKEYLTKSYKNPIYTQFEVADPSVIYCEEDNYYYIFQVNLIASILVLFVVYSLLLIVNIYFVYSFYFRCVTFSQDLV